VQQKEGQLRYAGSDGRQKIAVFTHYAPWNWVIVGEAAVDEITREVNSMRNLYIGLGLLFLAVLGAILTVMINRMITRPLDAVCDAADRIAGGDLTTRLHVHSSDEIGRLMTPSTASAWACRKWFPACAPAPKKSTPPPAKSQPAT
jgi:methyl-accepting chemotaxis protein-2 (aspartate sensor receptor)